MATLSPKLKALSWNTSDPEILHSTTCCWVFRVLGLRESKPDIRALTIRKGFRGIVNNWDYDGILLMILPTSQNYFELLGTPAHWALGFRD